MPLCTIEYKMGIENKCVYSDLVRLLWQGIGAAACERDTDLVLRSDTCLRSCGSEVVQCAAPDDAWWEAALLGGGGGLGIGGGFNSLVGVVTELATRGAMLGICKMSCSVYGSNVRVDVCESIALGNAREGWHNSTLLLGRVGSPTLCAQPRTPSISSANLATKYPNFNLCGGHHPTMKWPPDPEPLPLHL